MLFFYFSNVTYALLFLNPLVSRCVFSQSSPFPSLLLSISPSLNLTLIVFPFEDLLWFFISNGFDDWFFHIFVAFFGYVVLLSLWQ